MVPKKLYTLGASMIALVVALAGCATEESTGPGDPDLDPGAGQVPFDDTNDDIGTDDENFGDEETAEDNVTDEMFDPNTQG